jgi:lysophospholipase L1-like esterase
MGAPIYKATNFIKLLSKFRLKKEGSSMGEVKRIMCFGDSLTWGWVPTIEGAPTSRYPFEERWGGAMAIELGEGYEVLEEGLSARTTNLDDPIDPRLNGSKHLPTALASHFPLDLVIVMLGTNDTKSFLNRSPYEIANGLSQLLVQILTSAGGVGTIYPAPKALIITPPPLAEIPHPWFQGMFEGGHEKSKQLASQYEALSSFFGVEVLNAADHIATDGIHCGNQHHAWQSNRQQGSIDPVIG